MATVRKFHNNWVADYRDQWGKRHREKPDGHFDNKAQQKRAAQALLKRRLDEIDRGSYSADAINLTFSKLAEAYLVSKVNIRPSTYRSYESIIRMYLEPYFGSWKARQITAAQIEQFHNELAKEIPTPVVDAIAERMQNERPALSQARARQRAKRKKTPGPRTINKALTLLVMIFNYACRHRWVDFNPAEHVEKLREPVSPDGNTIDNNVLAPEEIRRLIDAAEAPHRDKSGNLISNNYRLLIQLAVFTGMRSGELRGLQWGDIDWGASQIHVRRSWKEGQFHAPKTKTSTRRIQIPTFLVSELRKWKLECPKGELDLVFSNLSGNPLSGPNLLQRGFYPALCRAGLRQIRFHDLRHTYASLMIANGEDIVRVSRLLGHASPKITLDVFAHMLPDDHYGSSERLCSFIYGKCENVTRERH